jgi:hypothetical protein
MDPVGVGNDKDKWGVITRMMNLDDVNDGNSPFKLFYKEKIEHFRLETGLVDIADNRMPAGIGVPKVIPRNTADQQKSESVYGGRTSGGQSEASDRVTSEQILIDPLTEEEISKTFALDNKGKKKYDSFGQPVYVERDRWFRIRAKFIWKNAPQTVAPVPGGAPPQTGAPVPGEAPFGQDGAPVNEGGYNR